MVLTMCLEDPPSKKKKKLQPYRSCEKAGGARRKKLKGTFGTFIGSTPGKKPELRGGAVTGEARNQALASA